MGAVPAKLVWEPFEPHVVLEDVKRFAAIAAFSTVAAIAGEAKADMLHSARDQPLVEVSHSVALQVEHGVAVYKVRRTFANNGKRADEARLAIDLPPGAAVTGLRIRARDRWYAAELLEREEAAARYQELTSMGAWQPKDPALMQWVWPDLMHLQVFPVMPGTASSVEYTLTVPLHYARGLHHVSYPRAAASDDQSLPLADPVLRFVPGYGDAATEVRVDGQRVAPTMPVVLTAPQTPSAIDPDMLEPWASHVWSKVNVRAGDEATHAVVEVEIDHTYRGDLSLALVTPAGEWVDVDDPTGSDNDIRESFIVELPPKTPSKGDWHLVVSDEAGLDVGTLEQWRLRVSTEAVEAEKFSHLLAHDSMDTPVFIPDAPDREGETGMAAISFAPDSINRTSARLGRVVASRDNAFLRLQVEAAPQLSRLPKQASVVFVVDASHSVGDVEWQLDVARAYLTHVPDAKVELVVFRRRAARTFGEFVDARKFDEHVDAARAAGAFSPGNGSFLDRGVREAERSLRGRKGPRRVIVLSDALMRSRFRDATAIEALDRAGKSTTAHIVVPDDGWSYEPAFRREDAHALAAIPKSTGGVLYRLEGHEKDDAKGLAAAVLGLVRPIAIDGFRVRGVELEEDYEAPERLFEGEGYGFMVHDTAVPEQVQLEGWLWSKRYRRTVKADRAYSRATAAFVFSEGEHEDLSEAEMMVVAKKGRAVSPVTSYLAIEPGVRPSTDGFDRLTGTGIGEAFGVGGLGMVGTGAGGGGSSAAYTLEQLIADGVQRCQDTVAPAGPWSVELELETTYQEVVDVRAVSSSTGSKMRDCVVEAAWDITLSWNFNERFEAHSLVLSGA